MVDLLHIVTHILTIVILLDVPLRILSSFPSEPHQCLHDDGDDVEILNVMLLIVIHLILLGGTGEARSLPSEMWMSSQRPALTNQQQSITH